MLWKIGIKDIKKKKTITAILCIFIILSTMMVGAGCRLAIDLNGAINSLMVDAKTPDYMQMYAGDLDQDKIDLFTQNNDMVRAQQTVEMINVLNTEIFFNEESKQDSVMDISLCKQNKSIDILLNQDNRAVNLKQGEIGIPIDLILQHNLAIGDTITIRNDSIEVEFVIQVIIRDSMMNSSIVSSKRLVISDEDYATMQQNPTFHHEYLIEFNLYKISDLSDFTKSYQQAGLPDNGIAIDYTLFKLMNAISDGVIIAIIMLISILLDGIAILCLRFTILSTLEEDYQEIGIMKGLGLPIKDIKKMYLNKYIVMTVISSMLGYFASLACTQIISTNISLYLGKPPRNLWQYILPIVAVTIIGLCIIGACQLVFKKLKKISAIQAIYNINKETKVRHHLLKLRKISFINTNIFLGIQEVFARCKMFFAVLVIFVISICMIVIPINFLNTLGASEFVSYMGVGESDIRIDVQQSAHMEKDYEEVIRKLTKDSDIESFAASKTYYSKVQNKELKWVQLKVEVGDFQTFPLKFLSGNAPTTNNQIALSYLNAQDLEKQVGDTILMEINGKQTPMTITGIYQDITNGGKTAKANMEDQEEQALWYTINVDVKDEVSITQKIKSLGTSLHSIKITSISDYLDQTFGNTIQQVEVVTIVAIALSIGMTTLISALFIKMLLVKDASQIAIKRSVGFNNNDIRIQYIVMIITIIIIATLFGTILSNVVGEKIFSMIGSNMGASNINFVIDPLKAYVLSPLIIFSTVMITTIFSTHHLQRKSIHEMLD